MPPTTLNQSHKDEEHAQYRNPQHLPTPEPESQNTLSGHQGQHVESQTPNTPPVPHERPTGGDSSVQSSLVPTIVVGNGSAQPSSNNIVVTGVEDNGNDNQGSTSPIEIDERTIEEAIRDLINEKHSEEGDGELTQIVLHRHDRLDEVCSFFDALNVEIREKCLKFDKEPKDYLIPSRQHHDALKFLGNYLNSLKPEELLQELPNIQNQCDMVKNQLSRVNLSHDLPPQWNIDVKEIMEYTRANIPAGDHSDIPDSDADDLDALESRTRKEQHQYSSCEVLSWWPKGTGTQTFVRYGDKSAPIYRIRAGSYEIYDKASVPRLWTTSSRGTAKKMITEAGEEDEVWKYTRSDVKRIIAVGWKVPDDDDSEIGALPFIKPERGAIYPQTKTMVLWKDGQTTLEGRSFIRRIANGAAFRGDEMIYQKAKELEAAYEKKNGPLQSSHKVKEEDESEYAGSDIDGSNVSDPESSSASSKDKVLRRDKSKRSHKHRASAKEEDIKKLERKLERLKSGKRVTHSTRQ
ncbi:uncharacterized protein N7506_000048 [Penicillium brevicompactum]|uniref:uncharacterized protein n=1 Tax=Penicillium brevicompactum TaxID=5074 RepID=UPI0025419774|nr:uncharacterized protein N7506_000048 [Penicillium brevicompactum]KAJ5346795.1 hypothetical protein N7506_000048 [Penicillium brevicompactum]